MLLDWGVNATRLYGNLINDPHLLFDVVEEAATGKRTEVDEVDRSPFSLPIKRSNTEKTYSRKRLLH